MRVLAIELSSPQGSVALLDNDEVVRECAWAEAPRDSRRAFDALSTLLRETGIDAGAIDLFAAGRGPGNYSGMRIALTMAAALSMPGSRPVHAVDSGAALADAVLQGVAADDVLIAGDARRGCCWHAVFHRGPDGMAQACGPWALCPAGELAARLPPAGVGATAEWERLAAVASLPAEPGVWLERSLYPSAAFVGRRAWVRWRNDEASEPLSPLYLHPAVARP